MIDAGVVARESAAWVWYPDDATVAETDEHLLVRWPDYYDLPPSLLRFCPAADVAGAFDRVCEQASAWGAGRVTCTVHLDAPTGFEELLLGRDAVPYETVDVLALDLCDGVPDLAVPADVTVRWRTDPDSVRDGVVVARLAFGEGATPPPDRIAELADELAADHREGRGGSVLARLGADPVGVGGLTIAGSTARLWSGSVVPQARGRGVYRALLAERLAYAVERGATTALVKGRVDTSGPILRRIGFAAYGQERSYRVSL